MKIEKSFHDDLPGESRCHGRVLTRSQQRNGEYRTRDRRTKQRRQQRMGLLDVRNVIAARDMKSCCRDDQDGGVDEDASPRAIVLSIVARRTAFASRRCSGPIRRVCTMAE